MADENVPAATPEITPPAPTPSSAAPQSPGDRLLKELQGDTKPADAAEPVAAEVAPEPETVEVPEPTFVQQLEAMGFQGVTDEKEAQKRVLEALQLERTKAQDAAQRAQELQRLRELEKQQADRPSQPTTASVPTNEQPARPWNLPELDQEQLERYQTVTTDPVTGKPTVAWAEGTPAELRQKWSDYETRSREWREAIVHRPHEVFAALQEEMLAKLPEVFEQRMAERAAQEQQQQFVESFKTENAAWLYTTDPVTKQPTGFSAEGQKFNQLLNEAHEFGIADPQKALAYAMRIREADKAKALANQVPPADVNEQKKRELLLRGAGNPPSQGGSLPTPTDGAQQRTQNPKLSAGERFILETTRNGVAIHP